MNTVNIAKNISNLRKAKGITQEQLAQAVNVSAQAVSKWETDVSQPDVQTLPLIAEFFDVSIDYLYYGKDMAYGDIFEKTFQKVASHPQMCKESYEDAFHLFVCAHHGISHGNIRGRDFDSDCIGHISNEGGVSLLNGSGFGTILTREYFKTLSSQTVDFSVSLLKVLADETCLTLIMAIISMSEIGYFELKERLSLEEDELNRGLKILTDSALVLEEISKHKALGKTYTINDMYHSGLCVLLAALDTTRRGLVEGISCCMGYGDFPISI